jgi:hypothetical protein
MKLKVGDIEMDSSGGIEFDGEESGVSRRESGPEQREGSPDSEAAVARREETPPRRAERAASESTVDVSSGPPEEYHLMGVPLPVASRGTYAVFAAGSFVVAAVVGSLAALTAVPMGLLIPGLLVSGVACTVMAARLDGGSPPTRIDAEVERGSLEKIAATLQSADGSLSVEDICGRLALDEQTTVLGLRYLVGEGMVDEDLDIDSGHWMYAWDEDDERLEELERRALPIEERAEVVADDSG